MLEKAFAEASKLSEIEQNALAKWLLVELEEERQWERTFAESEDVLENLAEKAASSFQDSKTRPLRIKEL
jgi:predicted amidophosphoribosyltransferase